MNVTNISTGLVVAAVALIDESGRVLMQRRRLESVHGGLWEFPGGKLEPGESAQAAALREISEELGLELDPRDLEPVTFVSGPPDGKGLGGEIVILLYSCRRWRGEPACLYAEEIGWYRASELAGLEMPPLDYPLAEKLASSLGLRI